jgi:hypothetical protein
MRPIACPRAAAVARDSRRSTAAAEGITVAGWVVDAAQVVTAAAAFVAVWLTWRAMSQERDRHAAEVRQARADRRSDELADLYESVLQVSAEIVGMLTIARRAGYVNKRDASALMGKINHAAALVRSRGGDDQVIGEFAHLAALAVAASPTWTSLLVRRFVGRRGTSDPDVAGLQDQLIRAADACREALALVQVTDADLTARP